MFKIPFGKVISFDCETTGISHESMPYCFSFCNEKGDTAVVSFSVKPFTREIHYIADRTAVEKLREFFEDKTITKVAHNAAFDVRMVEKMGIKVRGEIIDTMNLIRICKSDAPLKLKEFCNRYLGIGIEDETQLKEIVRQKRREAKEKGWKIYQGKTDSDGTLAPDYWLAPRTIVERYALTDAARAMAVYTTFIEKVPEKLWNQEKQTWKILRKIEKRGIRIFPEKITETINSLKKKLLLFQKQAYLITKKKINLNSSLQLRKIFYDKLKESTKFLTKAGYPSTDVYALKNFKHPLAKIILSIRACNKTIEFMNQYENYMVKHNDGCYYIHPQFHQAMTVTGRESCSAPNLQQVGSGRNDKGIDILVEGRKVFGARPEYIMRSYDWKNIEVFIPAFASGEKNLINVLMKGGDVHEQTAISLSAMCGEKITRDAAKRTFFGLLYGIGPKKLAKTLGVEEKTAYQIVIGFKNQYPILVRWMEDLKNDALTRGFITTRYGRCINISSDESYKAPNYFVQGTAGGILRNAKIKIVKTFKEKKWSCHIVLPIHDELLIEIPEYQDPQLIDRFVIACMQDNPELEMPIPIPVSISAIGSSWAEKTKIQTI